MAWESIIFGVYGKAALPWVKDRTPPGTSFRFDMPAILSVSFQCFPATKFLEVVSKPLITPEGKAQADSKAQQPR
jgi:hypothetical protein